MRPFAMLRRIGCWTLAAGAAMALGIVPVHAQRYTFATYTQDQGLGDMTVHSIFQDREGFLWAGTEGGLFRYDGKRFEAIDLGVKGTSTFISKITEDDSGKIWVAADTGLSVIENGVGRAVMLEGKPLVAGMSLSPSAVYHDGVILISDGSLWTVNGPGADLHVKPVKDDAGLLAHTKIRALSQGGIGKLWLATDAGIMRLDRRSGHVMQVIPDKAFDRRAGAEEKDRGTWSVMLLDHKGDLWMRGRGGVARIRMGTEKLEDLTTAAGLDLTKDTEMAFAVDDSGKLLTLHEDGIARWEGKAWKFFGNKEGFRRIPTSALMVDREGDVWFAQLGHGLQKWIGYGTWEHWGMPEGLGSDVVWGMGRDGTGRLVVADFERLNVRMEGGSGFRAMRGKPPEGRGPKAVIQSRDGSVWAAGGSPVVLRYGPGSDKAQEFRLPIRVFNLWPGTEGDVWIPTVDGIYHAVNRKGAWTIGLVPEGPAAHGIVYEIAEGQHGEFWAVSETGLLHYAQGRWTSVEIKGTDLTQGVSAITSGPGMPEGTMWLSGNFAGVEQVTVQSDRVVAVKQFQTPELSSDKVMELSVDKRGWIWVSTDHGMSLYDGKTWRWLTQEDGLVWNDVDAYGFFADTDGSVWIGTSGGLSHLIDPVTELKVNSLPMKILSVDQGKKRITLGGHTFMEWSTGVLTLRFASPDLKHQMETRFHYRLSDVDTGWVSSTTGEVRYAKVPPGKYKFEVFAENRALNQRSEVASIDMEVSAPWWRSLWFQALEILAIIGLVLLTVMRRDTQQSRRRHELEEIVRERTALLVKETEELKVAREELTILATRDHLTKLWNRRAIMDILFKELDRVRRDEQPVVIVLVDLDHFKAINDTLGHPAGDQVLREVSARLMQGVRTYDAVGRYGGEEILIVLPGLTLPPDTVRLEALHDAVCKVPVMINGKPVHVTASFGALAVRNETMLPEHALHLADEALYRAKQMGRARIEYARPRESTELILARSLKAS